MKDLKKVSRLCLGACLVLLLFLWLPRQAEAQELQAGDDIFIENKNVSGMKEEQLAQVVNEKLAQLQQDTILLYVNGVPVSATAGELGLTYTNTDIVQQVLLAGKQGNVLERFKLTRYQEQRGPLVFELKLAATEESVRNIVEERCVPQGYDAVDAELVHETGGSFYVTEKSDGIEVLVDQSVTTIMNYINSQWHGGLGGISVDIQTIPAQGDVEQLSLVQDLLGSYKTDYDTSQTNRSANIAVGSSKLDGILLYPGEELSVCETLEPFTAEAGYYPAPSYEMGSVVDSYGGGICQVSTTLYCAVLRAELEVTERSNHSMLVGYVDPSMDAAIAEGVKDFRFVNNTDAPVYIESYTTGGSIYFLLYGHETRDSSRSVTYESKTLTTTESTQVITGDSEEDFGVITTTDSGHIGKTAQLWKIVTVNGEEVSREQVNSSEYQMTPIQYTVGTKGASAATLKELNDAMATGDIKKVQEVIAAHP